MPSIRFILPAVLLLTSCATVEVGHEFDLSAFDAKVQRGVTTQADVRAWLGAPTGSGVHVDSGGERFQEWTYYHGEGRLPGMKNLKVKMLQIKFDQRGVVRAYNWSGEGK
jgi:hypothetical protein